MSGSRERTRLAGRLGRPARAIRNALGETPRAACETHALPGINRTPKYIGVLKMPRRLLGGSLLPVLPCIQCVPWAIPRLCLCFCSISFGGLRVLSGLSVFPSDLINIFFSRILSPPKILEWGAEISLSVLPTTRQSCLAKW